MQVKQPLQSVLNLLFFKSPLEAQLIVTRRCNLSCGYCSEFDNHFEIKGEEYLKLWDQYFESGETYPLNDYEYGRKLLQGHKPKWKCRSGSRYLYVDEFGLVQYCSSQRDRLNKPLTEYSLQDLRQQSQEYKGCEEGCSLLCVYRDSMLDNEPQEKLKGAYKVLSQKLFAPSN